MEQHLLDCPKQAWDCADDSPEPMPPPILSSEDSWPWPLPFYPKLGEPSADSLELFSSPPWRLHWVYSQRRLFPRAQSTVEGSSPLGAQALWPPTQTPEAPAGAVDPAEEPNRRSLQQLLLGLPPSPGDKQLDKEASDSLDLSELHRPPAKAGGSLRRVLAGCWERIRRVLSKPWGCSR
nr:annexin-2 receptor-like [Loxodonta africana]